MAERRYKTVNIEKPVFDEVVRRYTNLEDAVMRVGDVRVKSKISLSKYITILIQIGTAEEDRRREAEKRKGFRPDLDVQFTHSVT
ncbi:MAG: hypothetical protein JRM85_08040 [Nitrososphaerota archaeon]|jgi:hypothetical protein|nr:hypothetical protein [Nitrososphaerota archaeon]